MTAQFCGSVLLAALGMALVPTAANDLRARHESDRLLRFISSMNRSDAEGDAEKR